MRIVGGSARGREILMPKTADTRPMTDKTRESVFNILGPINGLKILDAYAGSGAVGLEALSRGAEAVDAIEAARIAVQTISQNVKKLGFEKQYRLFSQTVESRLDRYASAKTHSYDLIFVTPPHERLDWEIVADFVPLLKPEGILIVEYFKKVEPQPLKGAGLVRSVSYSASAISFYRKI